MAMEQTPPDPHRVAEHARKCIDIVKAHPKREDIMTMVHEAALAAWTRGAHELALESMQSAQVLLLPQDWEEKPRQVSSLLLQLAEYVCLHFISSMK